MQFSEVVLVDNKDNPIGRMEKLAAHEQGLLHRAFSIFVFNQQHELLLQQRALHKYHSAGLWSNTCCSHPYPDNPIETDLHDRLQFEMGMDCPLEFGFSFIYQCNLEKGLVEHELDHVYIGYSDTPPQPNPDEVMDWRWINQADLRREIIEHPERFTFWFTEVYERVFKLL
ncbi:MAG: isopentenyl-diphosphate Delta-isomerase [Bacteroidota bacterium]